MSRPFNKDAYDAFDLKNKKALLEIMKKKGYELVGDINEEHYKKYDVKFSNGEKEISFENETRVNFDTIKNYYPTIHIPIRKKNTQCDYYLVWKTSMDEMFLITKEVIKECCEKVVELTCNEFNSKEQYVDSFIDIPKERATHFKKIKNNWIKT